MNITDSLFIPIQNVTFSWYDYILFSAMLGCSALIGIYFGCFGTKQSTAQEYLMGGKKMKVFPVSMSVVASHISGITLLAVPADVYKYGAGYWIVALSMPIVALVTIFIFLPIFFRLKITSTYEYLERRFDSRTRIFASFLFGLSRFLYLPIVIYLPALAFFAATGINVHLVTPIVCGICIFYTTIGGLKAVVWTDTLQFTITLGAVATVLVLGVKSAGGLMVIWEKARTSGRLDLLDLDLDPTKRDTFWIDMVGITISWLAVTNISQSCVQKFLSLPTLHEAKLTVVFYALGIGCVSTLSVFTGLIIYSKYERCDPFATGQIRRNDQLLPFYVMDVASSIPGLSGLFIAGIFCAALSTLSASLNCVAGTIYEDFIRKALPMGVGERASGHILKLIVVVVGVACTALVFIIEHLGGILPLAISLESVTQGPMLGMYVLGVLFPRATKKGAFYGSLVTLLFASWMVTMTQYYKSQGLIMYEPKITAIDGCGALASTNNSTTPAHNQTITNSNETTSLQPFFLFRISFYYYIPLAVVMTVLVGLTISYFDDDDSYVDPEVVSSYVHFLLPSKSVKHYSTRTHIDYHDIDKAMQLITKKTTEIENNAKIDLL